MCGTFQIPNTNIKPISFGCCNRALESRASTSSSVGVDNFSNAVRRTFRTPTKRLRSLSCGSPEAYPSGRLLFRNIKAEVLASGLHFAIFYICKVLTHEK